jgi:predicted flap endonuclease-1-like 5' DNA nuclease
MLILQMSKSIKDKDQVINSLSQPAQRALANAGIGDLEQLAQLTEAAFKQLHGIGPKTLRQLREAMMARSLSFAKENK